MSTVVRTLCKTFGALPLKSLNLSLERKQAANPIGAIDEVECRPLLAQRAPQLELSAS